MEDLEEYLQPKADHASLIVQPANGDKEGADNNSGEVEILAEKKFEIFNASMRLKLKSERKAQEQRQWTISVLDREVVIRGMVEKFVVAVTGVEDFVSGAISSNPQAALAWSAVCFGLQASRPLVCVCGSCFAIQAVKDEMLNSFSIVREKPYQRTSILCRRPRSHVEHDPTLRHSRKYV